ncbi:MAG TPA: hypothetical protein GXX49_12045 [Clostridiaceae bacterium]|nr:hypothetical protein [Clostridiaceae bacterium]
MSFEDRVVSGPIRPDDIKRCREAVCIQTEKIYDSCKDKDCIEDARVFFRDPNIQRIINNAIGVKCNEAEVLDVFADVEPVPFKRGFYTVDVKFFIRVKLNFIVPKYDHGTKVITRNGVIVFDKKVILFGSEGQVKIFKSHFVEKGLDVPVKSGLQQDNKPIAKIEVAEPICLNSRIVELAEVVCNDYFSINQLPRSVAQALEAEEEEYEVDVESIRGQEAEIRCRKVVVATVGIFSIIKLARFVQLLIPAFDFCVPNKKCIASTDDEPCELFESIDFPVDEFFPPQKLDFPGALETERELIDVNKGKCH